MNIKITEAQLLEVKKHLESNMSICPNIVVSEEVNNYINQFNTDEELLRSGGLPTEMLDRLAFGFADVDIKTLNPKQLHIKWRDDISNVIWEQQKSGLSKVEWAKKINLSEPIDVSYEKNKFYIEDGHHRYYAAKILDKDLNVNLEIKMSPVKVISPDLSYDKLHRCLFKQVKNINEEIKLPVKVGDTIMMGKFKNKKVVIKNIGEDDFGMPTINGKKAATFRIPKKIEEEIISEATIDDVNLNSFKPKRELNDKFWSDSGKGYSLKPIVRKRLLKIADDFIEYLTIDIKKVADIIFLGSMANYNWSSYSDVDLHLIMDFSKINKDTELVTEYFDSKKKLWNDEHESLKIFGFPVELYVQDINQENASVGQFSLEKNKWLSKPEIIDDADFNKKKIKEKASSIMTDIEDLLKAYKSKPAFSELTTISNKTKKLYDKIKKLRKQGLESEDGETSVGNIVFKVLRRNGYFEKLIDLKLVTYDKINSIK